MSVLPLFLLCIDVEVLSKACHGCQKIETENDKNIKAIREAEHARKYKANFQGSALALETEELLSLQYTEFFGDGDSKAYLRVENFYENVHFENKECEEHVQKTVGTALRKLKKKNKGLGGKRKLTDAMLDKLQNCYSIAIRSNSRNLAAMRSNILASKPACLICFI